MEHYDCIVLGVGGFGSSALYHLARRGARVLGIERFGVAHEQGSSHGETRIIRKAYFEHPDYVPLLHRAYELWAELEAEQGKKLLHPVGLLEAGSPTSELIAGIRTAVQAHPELQVEELTRDEAARRFPGFRLAEDAAVVFEADAGYLAVEECVRAHVAAALRHGAVLRTDEAVREWRVEGGIVRVWTDHAEYQAQRLIVTAGPWAGQVLADLRLPLRVTRKVLFWHPTTTRHYDPGQGAPAFCVDTPNGFFYGFPSIDGQSVKVGEHTGGQPVADPLTVERSLLPDDPIPVAEFVRQTMPGLAATAARHKVCLYTNTPDLNFIIDRHPRHDQVLIAAGFSGHGFKFTSVIGEVLADLALTGQSRQAMEFLGLRRLAASASD